MRGAVDAARARGVSVEVERMLGVGDEVSYGSVLAMTVTKADGWPGVECLWLHDGAPQHDWFDERTLRRAPLSAAQAFTPEQRRMLDEAKPTGFSVGGRPVDPDAHRKMMGLVTKEGLDVAPMISSLVAQTRHLSLNKSELHTDPAVRAREARAQEEASTHAETIEKYGFSIGGSAIGGRVDKILIERLHPKDPAIERYREATESMNAEVTRQLGTEGQAPEPPVVPELLKSMSEEQRAGFVKALNAARGEAVHFRRDVENTTTFERGLFEAFLEVISHHGGSSYVSVVDAGSFAAIATGHAYLFRGSEKADVHVRCKDGHRLIAKSVPFEDGASRAITLLKLAAVGAFFNDLPDVASVETYAAKFGQWAERLIKVDGPGASEAKVSLPTDAYPFSDMDLSAEMQLAPELGLSPVLITVVTTIRGSVRYARETGTPEVVEADRAKLREVYEREAAAIGWSHASRAKTPFERPSLMASIMAVRQERQRREGKAELEALIAEAESEVKRVEGMHAAYINGAPWVGDPPDLLGALKKRSALRERAEKIGGPALADVAPQAKQDAARLPLDEEIYQRGVDWMATFPPSGPPSREAWKLSSSLIRHAHERIGQRSLAQPSDPLSPEEAPTQTPEAESLRLVAGRVSARAAGKDDDLSREASSALLFAATEIDRLSAERAAVIEHLGHGSADVDAGGVARDQGLVEGIKRRVYLAVEACVKDMIAAHERDLGRAVFIAKISERARFSLRLHGATEEDVSGGHELPDTDTFRAAARSLFDSLTPWTLSCLELAARGPGGPTPGTVIDLYQGVVSGLIRPKFGSCALALWPASDMLRATPKCEPPRSCTPPHDDDGAARRLVIGLLAPLERGEEQNKCNFEVTALVLGDEALGCARCQLALTQGDLILMEYEPHDQECPARVISDVRCAECASLLLRKAMKLHRELASKPASEEASAPAEAGAKPSEIEVGKPSPEG